MKDEENYDLSIDIKTGSTVEMQGKDVIDYDGLVLKPFVARFFKCDHTEDDCITRTYIGFAHGHTIHGGFALNEGLDLFKICDAHTQDMCELYNVIFDEAFMEKIEHGVHSVIVIELFTLTDDSLMGHVLYNLINSFGNSFDLAVFMGGQLLDRFGWSKLPGDWVISAYYLDLALKHPDFPIARDIAPLLNFTKNKRNKTTPLRTSLL